MVVDVIQITKGNLAVVRFSLLLQKDVFLYMNSYINEVVDRSGLSTVKKSKVIIENMLHQTYYDDTISLWVSEMDFPMAKEITGSIINRVSKGVIGYTLPNFEYFNSVINWFEQKSKIKIEKNWIIKGTGIMSDLSNSIKALTEEGNGVIIQPPVFHSFASTIKRTNRKVIKNNLKLEDGVYKIDFEDFEKKAKDPNNTMFIFCNPHNPIGEVWSQSDVEKLAEICKENDVIIFSDEVHSDILRKGVEFYSFINLSDDYKVMVATSIGKTFNLTGFHASNTFIKDSSLRKKIEDYTGFSTISPIVLEATISAYNDSKEWLKTTNSIIDANIDYLKEFLDREIPSIRFTVPKGTYLVWLDIRRIKVKEVEFLGKLSTEGKVVVQGGSSFGSTGLGFIRMSTATSIDVLEKALKQIKNVVQSIKE